MEHKLNLSSNFAGGHTYNYKKYDFVVDVQQTELLNSQTAVDEAAAGVPINKNRLYNINSRGAKSLSIMTLDILTFSVTIN